MRKGQVDSLIIVALCVALAMSLILWGCVVWVVMELWKTVEGILEVNEAQGAMIQQLVAVTVVQNEYLLGRE